jgi:hypothetical protein
MPKGVYKHLKHTNPNCQCMFCKSRRKEYKGKNNPFYGKHHTKESNEKNRKAHLGRHHTNPNCQCCSCKTKRGETKGVNSSFYIHGHKLDCQCCCCKTKRKEFLKHEINCQCLNCRTIRRELKGNKHHNWKGGIGNLPYPFNFNNELKELIRKRDNNTCQLCGRTKVQEGKNLCVHHIDYIKENLNPNNLLTLCRKCNIKVNYNREYWTKFFNDRK